MEPPHSSALGWPLPGRCLSARGLGGRHGSKSAPPDACPATGGCGHDDFDAPGGHGHDNFVTAGVLASVLSHGQTLAEAMDNWWFRYSARSIGDGVPCH
ncbi:unnamed protein product [Urochloa humidicola]